MCIHAFRPATGRWSCRSATHNPFRCQREEILLPYLRTLSSFRDGVRQLAISKSDSALKDILALSDKLRDVDLVPLGVALDDQEGAWDQPVIRSNRLLTLKRFPHRMDTTPLLQTQTAATLTPPPRTLYNV